MDSSRVKRSFDQFGNGMRPFLGTPHENALLRSLRSVHSEGLMRSLRSVVYQGGLLRSLRSADEDDLLRIQTVCDHPQCPWYEGLIRSLRSDDDEQVRRFEILRSLRSYPFLQERDNNYRYVNLRPLSSHGNEQDFIRRQGRIEP